MSDSRLNNDFGLSEKIPVGISQCLLGDKVRFDGGHKHSRFCTEHLSQYFEFTPSCPEVGAGLGTPRRPVRMVGDDKVQRVVDSKDNRIDVTDALNDYSTKRVNELSDLSGYIFMAKSPSCGVFRVKVYAENGYAQNSAPGVFAKAFMEKYPLVPVEEEGRLNDPVLLENFLVRVVIYHHWRQLQKSGLTPSSLLAFHQQIKFQLMAHSVKAYKSTGKMLSNLKTANIEQLADEYITAVMHGLKNKATRKTNTNVMEHIRGFFKGQLNKVEQSELGNIIRDYKSGLVPMIVPMTMLKHYVRRSGNAYIANQLYLQPYPHQLGLRNKL